MITMDAVLETVHAYLTEYPDQGPALGGLVGGLSRGRIPARRIHIAPLVAHDQGAGVHVAEGALVADLDGEDVDLPDAARRLAAGELRVALLDLRRPDFRPVAISQGEDEVWSLHYLLLETDRTGSDRAWAPTTALGERLAAVVAGALR